MTYSVEKPAKIHINIMELLVIEEIEKQLQFYSKKKRDYINQVEVATYALNRLPALYASTYIGKEHQKRLGQQKYKSQIILAVRRALAAVERDPLRKSVPLVSENQAQYELAKIALKKLEQLFKKQGIIPNNQKLSWNNLQKIIYPLITKVKSQNIKRHEKEFGTLTHVSNQLATEQYKVARASKLKQ
ncbi:MAG: late competence development ComFB family protein [Crocosphaera sp.]|nr:late competence development ComFB family protein [Crocosphaera sp.]